MIDEMFDQFLQDPDALEAKVLEDLEIDRSGDIEEYLRTQSERYFTWAALASVAEARAARQKYVVNDELWPVARTMARAIEEQRSEGGRRPSEARIDELAALNDEYRNGRQELVELEKIAGVLRGAERAMAQRLEMLRSLNSRQKVEFEAIPTDLHSTRRTKPVKTN